MLGKKHYRRAGTAPPKNLPPKAWDPNKPPGGELPVSDAPRRILPRRLKAQNHWTAKNRRRQEAIDSSRNQYIQEGVCYLDY